MASTRRLEELKGELEAAIDGLPSSYEVKLRVLYEQLEEEIDDVIDNYGDEISDLEYDKDKLERQISTLEDQVDNLEEKIEEVRCIDSLDDQLKEEWWADAKKKYTLPQLESVLGNRWNLKDIKSTL